MMYSQVSGCSQQPYRLSYAQGKASKCGFSKGLIRPGLSQNFRTWAVRHMRVGCSHGNGNDSVTTAAVSPDTTNIKTGKVSKLAKRAAYGGLLGGLGLFVILSGGVLFSCFVSAAAYQTSRELNEMVASMGSNKRTVAPPIAISDLMSVFCLMFPLMAYFYPLGGKPALMLSLAAFLVLSMEVLTVEKPMFSQLTAAVFGLFYCGFLISFWVKLRALAVPALATPFAQSWPVLLGGLTHWTVGLVATLTAVLCIVAADTGAYFVGKNLGKTQLIRISPKKTVEGTIGGLCCSSLAALACFQIFRWPGSPIAAVGYSTVVFVASVFGDLIESILKRDAGVKDSGSLIPGHGGLLDRFDSYIFTGAVAYVYVKIVLPLFGI